MFTSYLDSRNRYDINIFPIEPKQQSISDTIPKKKENFFCSLPLVKAVIKGVMTLNYSFR